MGSNTPTAPTSLLGRLAAAIARRRSQPRDQVDEASPTTAPSPTRDTWQTIVDSTDAMVARRGRYDDRDDD